MSGPILPLPNTPSWRGAQKKIQEQIYLYIDFTFILFKCFWAVTNEEELK
jgi:hypothetical protein